MRRTIVRISLAIGAVLLLGSPHSSTPQAPPDELAARTLLATNLANTLLNPAKAEDYEFFMSQSSAVPNIFFLVDTSGSMERLPADGPAFYGMTGGTKAAAPPGRLMANFTNTNANNAFANRTMVGCGLDPVSAASTTFSANPMIREIQDRKYYSPCGKTHGSNLIQRGYAGHPAAGSGVDYAYEASACPAWTPSNSQAVWPDNRGGFDPDFYNEAPNTTQVPSVLWVRDYVYHDSDYFSDPYARATNSFGHNFGKGWDASAPPRGYPAKTSSGSYASIDQFCEEQGTAAIASGQVPADVCKQCLRSKGWYYDGVILDDQDGQFPSVWYTGNYLSFFPPKFMVVRKIVKDILASQSKVRMALARYGSSGMSLLKEFNPTCAHPESNFDSNRGSYVNLMNGLSFEGGTPLSLALFDIGRYYHSPDLPWFSHEKTGNLWESSANANDYAICYKCQTSSVVVLTDGIPNLNDGSTLPSGAASLADSLTKYAGASGTGILRISTEDCPGCYDPAFTTTAGTDYKNNLTRVAWYMHNFDLRDNSESTKDCKGNGEKQVLDVYTVGYSTRALADANKILAHAADEGGGLFVEAENPALLKQGLATILESINARSTSFSVATVSTLQTASGHAVIIPRFEPSSSPFWQGHLYRYELWSEFVNECDPYRPASEQPNCCSPNGPFDLDCDGQCRSAFLTDAGDAPDHKNATFVQEGDDGSFYRNVPADKAACSQAPACGAGRCAAPPDVTSDRATPWWDAGAELRKKRWKDRRVYTVIDNRSTGGGWTPDGRIDRDDDMLLLDTATTASAKAILPYLGNYENRVCNDVANRIETAGDPFTAAVVRADEVECAQAIIRWILGADVFNEARRKMTDAEPWPPLPADGGERSATNVPDQERLPQRPFKLGDVFHSSPVDVVPPPPRAGILSAIGHPQVLAALWRAPSGEASNGDDVEYDAYAKHYEARRKIVLVGSNDGLLHAFNGGKWHPGPGADGDDPFTEGIDESLDPFNGYFDRGFPTDDPSGSSDPVTSDKIWAEELWAFLPPDMIAKLSLVFQGEHQLFVDGSAMVREVWADGTTNGMETSEIPDDDLKQAREYHTLAVVGERRGGTHYFALDVTDATKLPADGRFEAPRLLWVYPQPDDHTSLTMGETYTDFLPVPPPIGPVRIKATKATKDTPVFNAQVGASTVPTPFHEKWIAFLSGGFDQQYVRGRGVHMVDVWTGHSYWDFAYPENSASAAPDDPRLHLRYPVPATMGMVMWGPGARRENGLGYANNGFFDTATFGDTGGQLWTLRFHLPGELDSDDKVTNWFGARAFQMGGAIDESLGWAHPFFYITANTALPGEYIYRAFLGTGDRFNLLDKGGGVCGPGNIRACAMRGCRVDVELASNFAETPELGTLAGSQLEQAGGSLATAARRTTGGTTTGAMAKIVVSGCPAPGADGVTGFVKVVAASCLRDGAGRWGCERSSDALPGENLALSDTSSLPATRNWYFSVRVFEDPPSKRKPFATATEAKEYDASRLWIRDTGAAISQAHAGAAGFSIMSASAANPTSTADAFADGWAIYYDHGPTVSVGTSSYNTFATDERTSSVSGLFGVLTWNTTQPIASAAGAASAQGCFASKCAVGAGEDPRLAYHYGAHPLTGKSVFLDETGAAVRSKVSAGYVPSQGDQPTIFVNRQGQVLVGMTVVNPNKGARSVSTGDPTEAVKDLGWMEVSETVHACRHATVRPAAGVCR